MINIRDTYKELKRISINILIGISYILEIPIRNWNQYNATNRWSIWDNIRDTYKELKQEKHNIKPNDKITY